MALRTCALSLPCEVPESISTPALMFGNDPLHVGFFSMDSLELLIDRVFWKELLTERFEALPNRPMVGEPQSLILAPILKAADALAANAKDAETRTPDVTMFGPTMFALGSMLSRLTRHMEAEPAKVTGMVSSQFALEAYLAQMSEIRLMDDPKNEGGPQIKSDLQSALYRIFKDARLLKKSMEVRIGHPFLHADANQALGDFTIRNAFTHAGRGYEQVTSLFQHHLTFEPARRFLCKKVAASEPTPGLFTFMVALHAAMAVMDESVYETNFPPQAANTPETRARVLRNTTARVGSLDVEVANAHRLRDLIIGREVIEGVKTIVTRSLACNDALMADINCTLAAIRLIEGRFTSLKAVTHVTEGVIAAYKKLTGAEILLPDGLGKVIFGDGFDRYLLAAGTASRRVRPDTPEEILYPQAIAITTFAGETRAALLPLAENLVRAAEKDLLNLDALERARVTITDDRAPGYSMPELPPLHQSSSLGCLQLRSIRRADVFDVTLPAYEINDLRGRHVLRPWIMSYLTQTVNVTGVQLEQGERDDALTKKYGGDTRYFYYWPDAIIDPIVPYTARIRIPLPINYISYAFSDFERLEAEDIFRSIPIADIPGASVMDPIWALLTRFAIPPSFAGIDSVDDPALDSLRTFAGALAGAFIVQVNLPGASLGWKTVVPSLNYVWGAPTADYIAENLKAAVGRVDAVTPNRKELVLEFNDSRGRTLPVRLVLVSRLPVPGRTCPAYTEIVAHGYSSTFRPALVDRPRWVDCLGYHPRINGVYPHVFFRSGELYSARPEDLAGAFIGPVEAGFFPRVAYMPVTMGVIRAPTDVIPGPDNRGELVAPPTDPCSDEKGAVTDAAVHDIEDDVAEAIRKGETLITRQNKTEESVTVAKPGLPVGEDPHAPADPTVTMKEPGDDTPLVDKKTSEL